MEIEFDTKPDEIGKGRVIVNGRFYGLPIEAVEYLAKQQKALSTLAEYFTSGNLINIERATIKADDFWRITGMVPNIQVQAGTEADEGGCSVSPGTQG